MKIWTNFLVFWKILKNCQISKKVINTTNNVILSVPSFSPHQNCTTKFAAPILLSDLLFPEPLDYKSAEFGANCLASETGSSNAYKYNTDRKDEGKAASVDDQYSSRDYEYNVPGNTETGSHKDGGGKSDDIKSSQSGNGNGSSEDQQQLHGTIEGIPQSSKVESTEPTIDENGSVLEPSTGTASNLESGDPNNIIGYDTNYNAYEGYDQQSYDASGLYDTSAYDQQQQYAIDGTGDATQYATEGETGTGEYEYHGNEYDSSAAYEYNEATESGETEATGDTTIAGNTDYQQQQEPAEQTATPEFGTIADGTNVAGRTQSRTGGSSLEGSGAASGGGNPGKSSLSQQSASSGSGTKK